MLGNVRLGVKMVGGFILVALLVVVLGVISWIGANQLDEAIDEIGLVQLPSIESLLMTEISIEEMIVAQRTMMSPQLTAVQRSNQLSNFNASRDELYVHLERFHSLPATAEVETLSRQFDEVLGIWRTYNAQWLELVAEFDGIGILDPTALVRDLEQFRADHYALEVQVADMLITGQTFTGGDDPAACRFGRWLDQADLSNAQLIRLLDEVQDPHDRFHIAAGLSRNLYEAGDTDEALRVAAEEMRPASAEVFGYFDQLITYAEQAEELRTRMDGLAMDEIYREANRGQEALGSIIRVSEQAADAAVDDAHATSTTVVTMIVVTMIVAFVVAVLLGVFLSRGITKPISTAVAFAQKIALGDLSGKLEIRQRDEVGQLADAMREMQEEIQYNASVLDKISEGDITMDVKIVSEQDQMGHALDRMVKSLNDVLGQVHTAVEQVAAGAQQVSSASQDLSQGATESASSLEEISSSVNEINGQSSQNADNATEANGIAQEASTNAGTGQQQMKQLREAMAAIADGSGEIGRIVKVIDDIAFQINLLALNANVEAARAGKYGKGFAVVAEEVRNLAVRAAEAVKETESIVSRSVSNIDTGNRLTETTAEQLEQIVEGSTKVANFLEEIAAASKEQALAIEQITSGLGQVDQVTQSNTASAEESASASEELSSQAEQLRGAIAIFKLKEMSRSEQAAQWKSLPAAGGGNGHGNGGRSGERHAAAKAPARAGKPAAAAIALDDDRPASDRNDDQDFDRF